MSRQLPKLTSRQVVQLRPDTERPAPTRVPLDVIVEQEPLDKIGTVGMSATLFLVGSECRFRCVMCDLWKYTHREATPAGYLVDQVRAGIQQAQDKTRLVVGDATTVDCIKLYNASNFFASANVPEADLPEIASLVASTPRVVVENHPSILTASICQFRDRLDGTLEVALGLETTHTDILPRLNKSMTLDTFRRCTQWLGERQVESRAFVLLNPPGLEHDEATEACLESIRFAESCGVRQVSVIPVRKGNGAIDHLEQLGAFEPPPASMLEAVMQQVDEFRCIVTADLWDWNLLAGQCDQCGEERRQRLHNLNLQQRSQADALGGDCNCGT
ncbi:MAG: hypothetical protein Aurels2KO_44570 [Aureliella sp.]